MSDGITDDAESSIGGYDSAVPELEIEETRYNFLC